MLNSTNRVCVLLSSLAACNALAQTTVPGDVTIAPGGTLIINDDTTYTGTLTIGAGAQVVVDAGFEINFASGATLTVNGTAAEPVMMFPINSSWDGLHFQSGSVGELNHAIITDFRDVAIEIEDADVVIRGGEVYDSPGFSVTHGGRRYAVNAGAGAELSIDGTVFGRFQGKNGSAGSNATGTSAATGGNAGNGEPVTVIGAVNADRLSVTNAFFDTIQGGDGGKGGTGGRGTTGDDAPDAILFNGIQGDPGGTGGLGGNGGTGGSTIYINSVGVGETLIAQNIFNEPRGGRGGQGGNGGKGGTGGQGGDGAGAVFGNGGRGGTGGTGGKGGKGGTGGASGSLETIRIVNPVVAPVVANNTIYRALARVGGAAGSAGAKGSGGAGGAGGGAGLGGSTGATGSTGSAGASGTTGTPGTDAPGKVVVASGTDANGFAAIVSNNAIVMADPGPKQVFQSNDSGIIDMSYNLATGFNTLSTGPALGALTVLTGEPLFVDAGAGDFTPATGSPAIDAGNNDLVPGVLVADYLGNARFADDAAVPNTGLGGQYIADMGAIEAPGDIAPPDDCLADTNGDGAVSPADFNAWIIAFNTQAPSCDQNSDTQCTPADFNAWIINYNAGCD